MDKKLKILLGLILPVFFIITQVFKGDFAYIIGITAGIFLVLYALIEDKKSKKMTTPAKRFLWFFIVGSVVMIIIIGLNNWGTGTIITSKWVSLGFPIMFLILIFVYGMVAHPEFKKGTPLFKQTMGGLLIMGLLLLNLLIYFIIRK